MNKSFAKFAVVIIVALMLSFTSAYAEDNNKVNVTMQVTYGVKSTTERQYLTVQKKTVNTFSGEQVQIEMTNKDENTGIKIEITPTASYDKPELVVLKIKAWEKRYVYDKETEKTEKKYVEFLDQTSRVKRGATLMAGERLSGMRDVQVTITPNFKPVPQDD